MTGLSGTVVTRVLGVSALVGWTLWFVASGDGRGDLLVEDGPLEMATAIVFVVAVFVGVRAMRRSGAPWIFWTIPGFALLAALDELSFGARVFGFDLPTIRGVEVDSLHDVFDIADRFLGDVGVGRTMAAAGLLALALAGVAALAATGRLGPLVEWIRHRRPLWFVAVAIGMLGTAVIIDQVSSSDVSRFAEEMLEFGAAVVMVLGALSIDRVAMKAEAPA